MTKPTCYIFDLDGTLANIDHRTHFVRDGKKDWKSFFEAAKDDTVYDGVRKIFHLLGEFNPDASEVGPYMFVVTARPENYYVETTHWLAFNGFDYDRIFMRKAGDFREDAIIKEEILKNEILPNYDVLGVFDDRPSVVKMWKKNGLTVFHVNAEHWEETAPTPPNIHSLSLMVGPSGAGKSSYLKDVATMEPNAVISSDAIRQELCLDFKDQSRNADVFRYLHKIVKARCDAGLNTWVDATNIRNADRKKFLELINPKTVLFYYVIDRPMNEKIATRDWRPEWLLEKHRDTFQSNLKDILSGDGGVAKVIDLRKV